MNGDGQITPSNGIVRESFEPGACLDESWFRLKAVQRQAAGRWTLVYSLTGKVLLPDGRWFTLDKEIRVQVDQHGRKPRICRSTPKGAARAR